MAELLSREKEFIKLNQELDQLTVTTLDKQLQLRQHHQPLQPNCSSVADSGSGGAGHGIYSGISTQSTNRNEQQQHQQRYLTYTKAKGPPSTLLKKRVNGPAPVSGGNSMNGGGVINGNRAVDGTTNIHTDLATIERNVTHRTTMRKPVQYSNTSTLTSNSVQRPDGGDRIVINVPAQYEAPKTTTRTSSTMHRKHIKSPESGTTTRSILTRGSNCSSRAKEANFTVKYRNPKFVQSPSLEVLVREESTAIRKKGCGRNGVDVDESTLNDGAGGSFDSRRSVDAGNKKNFSAEGLIKFLKSKITILEEDHERISQEMSQQKEMLEKTLERNKKIEQQRDQAYAKHNTMAEQLTKTEAQLDELNRRIKERNMEHGVQQKELEKARREIKVLTQTNTNLEKRLYRANEELESTKSALALLKNAERELKESMRGGAEAKDKQIKSLKKQRADLLNAYKKQLFLIDNLKRQNICMEQSKMINFGEKEFTKVLEWNTKM